MTSFSTGRQRRGPEPGWIEDPAPLRFATEQLEEYFAGDRVRFDLPLTVSGTEFQRRAWQVLQTIPYGEA